VIFLKKLPFILLGIVSASPNSQTGGLPLLAIRDCLFKYSQLPSTSGGHFLHPQNVDALCRSDRDQYNMNLSFSSRALLHAVSYLVS
jgi:hypothetical protein